MPDSTLQTPDEPERLTPDLPEGFTLATIDTYGRGWYDLTHLPCGQSQRFSGATPDRIDWYTGSHRCGGQGWQQGDAMETDPGGAHLGGGGRDEPVLVERLLKVLTDATELVGEVPEGDDLDGGELLEAAQRFAAVVRGSGAASVPGPRRPDERSAGDGCQLRRR